MNRTMRFLIALLVVVTLAFAINAGVAFADHPDASSHGIETAKAHAGENPVESHISDNGFANGLVGGGAADAIKRSPLSSDH